jgi:hypothetical protein
MIKILLMISTLLLFTLSTTQAKSKCKKGQRKISCGKIKSSKRKSFCWKGEISKKRKNKICKTKKSKKKKTKKSVSKRNKKVKSLKYKNKKIKTLKKMVKSKKKVKKVAPIPTPKPVEASKEKLLEEDAELNEAMSTDSDNTVLE